MNRLNLVISVPVALSAIFLFLYLGSISCSPYVPNIIIADNEHGNFSYRMVFNSLVVNTSSYPNHKILLDDEELINEGGHVGSSDYISFCHKVREPKEIKAYSDGDLIYSATWRCKKDTMISLYHTVFPIIFFVSFLLTLIASGLCIANRLHIRWLIIIFAAYLISVFIGSSCM